MDFLKRKPKYVYNFFFNMFRPLLKINFEQVLDILEFETNIQYLI